MDHAGLLYVADLDGTHVRTLGTLKLRRPAPLVVAQTPPGVDSSTAIGVRGGIADGDRERERYRTEVEGPVSLIETARANRL